jgi:Xaa-Pro aminopeptidase
LVKRFRTSDKHALGIGTGYNSEMLNAAYSRQRQQRLLAILQARKLDAMVLGLPQHVYYASAHRPFWLHSAGFILLADGTSIVASANCAAESAAADHAIAFDANWMGTQRQDQPAVVADQINSILKHRHLRSVGIDASAVTSQLAIQFAGRIESVDAEIWQARRSKFPDELELMRTAIKCTYAMYDRAREIIEPGLSEIDLYADLHSAAVKSSGEPMTALLGNDYACGAAGGPPRHGHRAKAGELWVLDLGPSYRGYFADNARVFSVDPKPTDIQLKTWHAIIGVFPIVEKMVRPGVKCSDVFDAVDDHLKHELGQGLPHHLGHGVGLQPHEFPHLNPKWDDSFIEGDIFTAEPGAYGKPINGGIRIENQYRVTATGVENLVDYPMQLA